MKVPTSENMTLIARFRKKNMKGLVGGLTDALAAVWLRVLISIKPPPLTNPTPLPREIPFL
jgi:hypothetical protein